MLECQVDDVYNTPNFETFILKILHTYVEEDMLNENGKPDYAKISPVLFEFPNYQYLSHRQSGGPLPQNESVDRLERGSQPAPASLESISQFVSLHS